MGTKMECYRCHDELSADNPWTRVCKSCVAPRDGEAIAAAYARGVQAAAKLCEQMVVGGRAWSHDQSVAADALLTAAERIRSLLPPPSQQADGMIEVKDGDGRQEDRNAPLSAEAAALLQRGLEDARAGDVSAAQSSQRSDRTEE